MKPNVFNQTVYVAFVAMLIVFGINGCQKDPSTPSASSGTEEECINCGQNLTSQLMANPSIEDEERIEFEDYGRSGFYPIFLESAVVFDNVLEQSSTNPRTFTEFNKHVIELITKTKLPGISAGINGVVHSGYKIEIKWKDGTPSYVVPTAYVAGTAPTSSYIPVNLLASLIHISSLMKWKTVTRGPQSTKAKYYDDYYCKEKYNYLYTITTQNGSSAQMRKNGLTETAIIYVPQNI